MEINIDQMYRNSLKMKSDEKIEYLESLLIICEDTEEHFYEYLTRFELIKEYREIGQIYKTIQLYRCNIDTYLEHKYDGSLLLTEFPWMARHIDSVLGLQQTEINDFFSNMKKVFELNSRSLRSYFQESYSYLMRVGKWEEGFSIYTRWMVESRDKFSQSIGKEEADRAFYYFSVGDYQNGKYVFETVRKGIESSRGTRTYAYPRAVKDFFEQKDWGMTSYLMQRGYDYTKNNLVTIEEVAEIMKPLSILNPKIAMKLWEKHRYHFKITDNQRAKYSYGLSSYLLEKSLGKYLSGSNKQKKLSENIKEMYDIQNWMDTRNGTVHYQEELTYWTEIWKNFNKAKNKN